jgi:chromosome segregation ATPase
VSTLENRLFATMNQELENHRRSLEPVPERIDHLGERLEQFSNELQPITEALERLQDAQALIDMPAATHRMQTLETSLGNYVANTAETFAAIETRMADLQGDVGTSSEELVRLTDCVSAQQQAVVDAASQATRLSGVVSTLENRLFATITNVSGQQQVYTEAIEALGDQIGHASSDLARVVERLTAMEGQVGRFEDGDELLRTARESLPALEVGLADTNAVLRQIVDDVDQQKEVVARAAAEASRATAIVSAIETRANTRNDDPALKSVEQMLARLEQRVAHAKTEFDARLSACEARQYDSGSTATAGTMSADVGRELEEKIVALVEAGERRAKDVRDGFERLLDDLEAARERWQVVLTKRDRSFALAEHVVERFEQWTADATAHIERRFADLERQRAAVSGGRARAAWSALTTARVQHDWSATSKGVRQIKSYLDAQWIRMRQLVRTVGVHARVPHLPRAQRLGLMIGVPLVLLMAAVATQNGAENVTRRPVTVPPRDSARILASRQFRSLSLAVPEARRLSLSGTGYLSNGANPSGETAQPVLARADAIRSKGLPQFTGALIIDSDPAAASVFVDRQQVGETPVRLTTLRAGSHVVRIERDGYEHWTSAVLVVADKQTRVDAMLTASAP